MTTKEKRDVVSEVESHARGGNANAGFELIAFMKDNKKWWLAPIIVVLMLMALLMIAGGTGAAPFIYTLF